MTMINAIEPSEWSTFLSAFTGRNRGRRARFEIFGPKGAIKEEQQEGRFESISISGGTVTVVRSYFENGGKATMTDDLKYIRGIAAQYDTDKSVDMLEFSDANGGLTALHFESHVDGDS